MSWAAPLLCFGVAPVSSLCRGYYSYSRLLSDSVFEGVGVRLTWVDMGLHTHNTEFQRTVAW